MHVHAGYDITIRCPGSTPMLLWLQIHPSRTVDVVYDSATVTAPCVAQSVFLDAFGNSCSLLLAPRGEIRLKGEAVVFDTGRPDRIVSCALETSVESLPIEAFPFLSASRYCETDLLQEFAWERFSDISPGWQKVQSICDFVHCHIEFDYAHARSTRTAQEAFVERKGVCRDYAHLAITLCRCMNIPARYCMGYVACVGGEVVTPADFAGWMEVFLEGEWYVFDPRNNQPCVGRVLLARGKDAADVPMINAFGEHELLDFSVRADQLAGFGVSSVT